MHGTTIQRQYQPYAESQPYLQRPYWGWSHRNQRMEFMDLPSYMDSFQQGYNAAFGDLLARIQQFTPAAALAGPATGLAAGPGQSWPGDHEHGRHRHHGHRHHGHGSCGGGCGDPDCHCGGGHRDCGCGDGHRDHDCGCRHDRDRDGDDDHWHGRHDRHDWHGRHDRHRGHDCRCDCCIVDADIVVYAHCGEIRAVPIEVVNDTRKIRENVDVQVSDVRSSGGQVLPWQTLIQPVGPLTLQPCSTTRLELLVHVVCGDQGDGTSKSDASGASADAANGEAGAAAPSEEQGAPASGLATLIRGGISADVDRCEVGYTTIRLDGCLIRPIVVAIAVLPLVCDSYRTGCACSCCGC
jgi:hypothetical protein